MATDTELKTAVDAGLESALQRESVQEADRRIVYPDLNALLDARAKIDRGDAAAKQRYSGPRRLLADFTAFGE